MPKRISIPRRDELAQLKATLSYDEIATHYGVSRALVGQWLKKRGLTGDQPIVTEQHPASIDGYRHRLDEQGRQTIRSWYKRMIAHKRRQLRVWAELYDIDEADEYELEEL